MQLVLFGYFFVIRVSLNRLWMKMTSASGYYWPAFDGLMHHKLEVPSHFFWDNRYKPKFTNDTSFKNLQQGILILIYRSISTRGKHYFSSPLADFSPHKFLNIMLSSLPAWVLRFCNECRQQLSSFWLWSSLQAQAFQLFKSLVPQIAETPSGQKDAKTPVVALSLESLSLPSW